MSIENEFRLINEIDQPSLSDALNGDGSGAWNMAVDEHLMSWTAEHDTCCLRLYRWTPATLSLGYFQRAEDRDQHRESIRCPMVRRTTGGGAILHDRELTYSLSIPIQHPLAGRRLELYAEVHHTLIHRIEKYGISARLYGGESKGKQAPHDKAGQPEKQGSSTASTVKPFLCFERRSPGDVVVDLPDGRNLKIVGSAQRRTRSAILQHGSILLARSPAAPQLPGLFDVVDGTSSQTSFSTQLSDFAKRWIDQLQDLWQAQWLGMPLTDEELQHIRTIRDSKFSRPCWTIDKCRA